MLPYDKKNAKSIENYARRLLGKSLIDLLGSETKQVYTGKGKLGQLLEGLYFQYTPNSSSEPDFAEAGIELKTSPIKKIKKGYVSKERLVLNIINFQKEYKNTFEKSAFWKKNKVLLLMFYLYENEKIDLDYIFKIIRLWSFPKADIKIIKDDWTKIIKKIKDGKAHEISEGDTLYLGACTKGANRNSKRVQPYSTILAMQRAYSLKSKYLNFIIKEDLIPEESEPIVKTTKVYSEGETFEDLVIKKFTPYYNMSESDILKKFNIKLTAAKSKIYLIAKAILGVSKKKIEEFEKADVEMKTIRLGKNNKPKESMSFHQIQFSTIINEKWEESYWYNTLTKRFFFVVFQKDSNNILRLKKVFFWTMPQSDLKKAKIFWDDTKRKIVNDDFKHFIKISDNMICHVRPKGKNSLDKMKTSSGRFEKKKCYWLNSSYIAQIVK